ncbi:preprotein translocase subunit SecF [Anaerosporomusa subterranea]|uniref:Protein-export membrane protein SecF n=1 Tax=Anaerosporomusa subterranea TaxID=1794912 RepID=A0A154BVQ0_ANASB|nr:protein translocase subunit SecF [Anaerosporomusa subterranea]KYZ77568.1 preprotein translocase subunit SecF [Anaerosporomusa subterranea]
MKYSFPIIKRSKLWFLISALFIVPGLISMMVQGFNFGIDFTGGTLLDMKFAQPVSVGQVREVLKPLDLEQSVIQLATSEQTDKSQNVLIRTRILSDSDRRTAVETLQSKLGKADVLRNEHVGAVVGGELARNAIYALLASMVMMVIYITYRFEFKFAISGIAALVHDVLVVLGFFSIFQIEIDGTFVAALLTIIGYSINDTIVIFDRIRENLKTQRKDEALDDLVDRSIWQTMTRSIYTVLTVLFTTLSLYVFGGESTKNFALAMLVGIASGSYSTLFNASPIWVALRNREQRRRQEARARGAK